MRTTIRVVADDMLALLIDERSPLAPFEQVRSQLAARAAEGTLVPGTRLPPVRRLAEQLGLAPNTVARAYRELEAAGVVETRGRHGTVVSAGADRARARLQDAAQHYACLARDLGVGTEPALAYVRSAIESLAAG